MNTTPPPGAPSPHNTTPESTSSHMANRDADDVENASGASVKSRKTASLAEDNADARSQKNKPSDAALLQQVAPAWQPILTPYSVIPSLILLAVLFIPLGVVILISSASVQEYAFDYTDCLQNSEDPIGLSKSPSLFKYMRTGEIDEVYTDNHVDFQYAKTVKNNVCKLKFKIDRAISGPVFMYYRLQNFYQNQRLYVRSVDWDQMAGVAVPLGDLRSNCAPLAGPSKDSSQVYYPCGLIANSYFSDMFSNLVKVDDSNPAISLESFKFSNSNISHESERKRYGTTSYSPDDYVAPTDWNQDKFPQYYDKDGKYDAALLNIETNERFHNWMSVAGLPVFRKLYGRLDSSIPSGTYTMLIRSTYDVSSYGARKSLVISNTSWLGGRSTFLGWAYIVVGILFLVLAFMFLARHMLAPRRLGDTSYLSWNQASPATAPLTTTESAADQSKHD